MPLDVRRQGWFSLRHRVVGPADLEFARAAFEGRRQIEVLGVVGDDVGLRSLRSLVGFSTRGLALFIVDLLRRQATGGGGASLQGKERNL